MKYIVICLIAFIAFCGNHQEADAQLGFINCPAKIASALLGECQKRLQERLGKNKEFYKKLFFITNIHNFWI
jgi:hypothetical protein